MIKPLLLSVILAFSLPTLADSKPIYKINDDDIQLAAEHFKAGDYSKAQKIYLKLAGAGDKYAQYILSVIELNGLVEEPNTVKAFAWAKVAKENNSKPLIKHYERVSKLLSAEEKEKNLDEISSVYLKYSNMGVAERYLRHLKDDFPKCTGSRTGISISACERITVVCNPAEVYSLTMPIPDYAGNEKCLEFVAKIRTENLVKMKKDISKLQTYVRELEHRTGTVTVSEESQ